VLDELLATPGVREECRLRSRVGFLAIHGGLEQGTAEIARATAARAGASLYVVEQPDDVRWHVPSHRFDPSHSEGLGAFCAHVEVAISLHGYGRAGFWTRLLLGGSNRELAGELGEALRLALPGYEAVTDLAVIPPELRGLHGDNPVNRPRGGGVQVELPPRVRGLGPRWASLPDGHPCPHVEALVAALAEVALRPRDRRGASCR
jgi:phage replication-related protein YjqB (UPF0714/DUF867 family)